MFSVKRFVPVFIVNTIYKNNTCPYCRGLLTEYAIDSNTDEKNVILERDDMYVHQFCYDKCNK